MNTLNGTYIYEEYWRKRACQLTDKLMDKSLTPAERIVLNIDLEIIYEARKANMEIIKKNEHIANQTKQLPLDVCLTCDDGICTTGCIS